MARRRLRGPARRELILEAATSAFATAGYEGTRVSQIAEMVGVTDPVIFQNFGTKAELFAAVLERSSTADAVPPAPDGGEDALQLVGRMLSPEAHDRMHSSGGLGVLYAEADARPEPAVREAFRRALDRVVAALAAILRRGQEDGSIRDDVEAATLAWLVLSLVRAREFRRVHVTHPSGALEDGLLAAVLDTLRT
ncbi:MAG: TetR/AcrR family transcriptional regulator [bacterium]|nr:TetR/AcrR family transcriptional regulator [bacterium]